jgi:alkylation response protein AidB-like acyl-CoA dehydrogenase
MDEDGVVAEFREWLDGSWDEGLPLREWRRLLVDSGWAVPSWPAPIGKGLTPRIDDAVARELTARNIPGLPGGVGMSLAAPTLREHASAELQAVLLPPLLTGEHIWCQLFSEPGAGSDLAGVTTTAVRDGDEWTVNGQKVWNTSAHHAHYGLLLARTDWDAPKHRGLTYFALPMIQPGVEARPLRQMNGHASFNEVFVTDARIPAANVVGDEGDGWRVALTTLAHERRFATQRPQGARSRNPSRAVRESEAETADYMKTYVWYPQRAGRADLLADRARATGKVDDAVVRQRLASVTSLVRVNQWTAQRARDARVHGRPPGPEGSLGKLGASIVARAAAAAHSHVAGASGMLSGPDAPLDGTITEVLISVPAQSIAGGTDEVQHNILGERVLGLPKEPDVDRDVPFREVRRNA